MLDYILAAGDAAPDTPTTFFEASKSPVPSSCFPTCVNHMQLVPLVLHHQLLAAERLAALQLVVADAPGLWGQTPTADDGNKHVADVGSGAAKGMEDLCGERGAGKGREGNQVGTCSSNSLPGGSAPPGAGIGGSVEGLGASSGGLGAECGTGWLPEGGGRLSGDAFGVLVAPLHSVATVGGVGWASLGRV